MKNLVLIAGIASLGLAAGALAGGPDHVAPVSNNAVYAGVNGGVAIPTGDGSDQLSTGYNVGAQVGYRMGQFRVEEAYNFYNHNASDALKTIGVDNVRYGMLMTNAYYDIKTGTNFVPFVGAGIGWLHSWGNTSDSNVHVTSDNEFAYQGIAGVDYKLDPNMTVGVNYRYVSWTNADGAADSVINATYNYYFS